MRFLASCIGFMALLVGALLTVCAAYAGFADVAVTGLQGAVSGLALTMWGEA